MTNPKPSKKASEDAATFIFTLLGFFIPGAFNLNYSSMFVMAILTYIASVLFLFPPSDES
jgi:hypothetical protein